MLIRKIMFVGLSLLVCAGLSACGKKEDKPKPNLTNPDNNDDDLTEAEAIAIGQEISAEGDVLKDENDMFALTKIYLFNLDKETKLQVRKIVANANCGSPNAYFFVMKGEEQVTEVLIDRDKNYAGRPIEQFEVPLAAGDYMLVTYITLDQECKNMLFFYDFALEEVK